RAMLERVEPPGRRPSELEKSGRSPPASPPSPESAPATVASTAPGKVPVAASAPVTDPGPQGRTSQVESATSDEPPKKAEPFAFADFSWLSGNSRARENPLQWGPLTGEVRLDIDYVYDFNHPRDHTISGSSEIFRSGEVQVTQVGIGGDLNWKNVLGRVMTQFGMYSQTTPRNDASTGVGQWNLDNAYRYISEAYGGYHL